MTNYSNLEMSTIIGETKFKKNTANLKKKIHLLTTKNEDTTLSLGCYIVITNVMVGLLEYPRRPPTPLAHDIQTHVGR